MTTNMEIPGIDIREIVKKLGKLIITKYGHIRCCSFAAAGRLATKRPKEGLKILMWPGA